MKKKMQKKHLLNASNRHEAVLNDMHLEITVFKQTVITWLLDNARLLHKHIEDTK